MLTKNVTSFQWQLVNVVILVCSYIIYCSGVPVSLSWHDAVVILILDFQANKPMGMGELKILTFCFSGMLTRLTFEEDKTYLCIIYLLFSISSTLIFSLQSRYQVLSLFSITVYYCHYYPLQQHQQHLTDLCCSYAITKYKSMTT